MLSRIRKALATGKPHGPAGEASELAAPLDVMPPIERRGFAAKFELELTAVGGQAYGARTAEELDSILRRILEQAGARSVVLSRNPLLAELGLRERIAAWGKAVAVWEAHPGEEDASAGKAAFRAACFAAEVGITGVDFALAETGSLVVTSRTEGSQLASLAPPVHVALFRQKQLRGSLEEIVAELPGTGEANAPDGGRSVVFITGTSRTADIEQTLVRGVHGPRELHAIMVEDAVAASSRRAPGEAP